MTGKIDKRAFIDEGVKLGKGVSIGPFSYIESGAEIGDGTIIGPNVVIRKNTRIGKNCRIYQFASIGEIPQDLKFKGEDTYLEIGDGNIIREFVTINRGTGHGGGVTRIGDGNLLMAYVHVAHDCSIGNGVILANAVNLAGHVTIEDNAILGGLTAVHQFVRIGRLAFIGGMSGVAMDIPPFVKAAGNRTKLYGINTIGLKRHGFSNEVISALKRAYRIYFMKGLLSKEAIFEIKADHSLMRFKEVQDFVRFLESSERGICRKLG